MSKIGPSVVGTGGHHHEAQLCIPCLTEPCGPNAPPPNRRPLTLKSLHPVIFGRDSAGKAWVQG